MPTINSAFSHQVVREQFLLRAELAPSSIELSAFVAQFRVFDHHGMTEMGPVSYECPGRRGVLHIIEAAYFPEVIEPSTLEAIGPGGSGELVLTNLEIRAGTPRDEALRKISEQWVQEALAAQKRARKAG